MEQNEEWIQSLLQTGEESIVAEIREAAYSAAEAMECTVNRDEVLQVYDLVTEDRFTVRDIMLAAQKLPIGVEVLALIIKLYRLQTYEAYSILDGTEETIAAAAHKAILTYWPEEADKERTSRPGLQELFSLKAVRPDSYVIPNSIVNNSLTKGIINAGLVSLDPSKGHKAKYHVYAAVTLDPNEYAVGTPFTGYDRRVFNGVCSLYAAGNTVFTAEMVYRAMNGLSSTESVSPQQAAAITKSLNKQRNIDIHIDATQEFKKRKLIDPKDDKAAAVFEAKCLETRKVTVKTGGQKKTAYSILAKPVLFEYSEQLKQVISVKSELLAIKDETGARISNTDNMSAIREYLLQRIEQMKSQKRRGEKVNNVIDIQTFYQETDTRTDNSRYMTAAREQAAQCLEYWTREGYIKGYLFVKKNQNAKTSPILKIEINL